MRNIRSWSPETLRRLKRNGIDIRKVQDLRTQFYMKDDQKQSVILRLLRHAGEIVSDYGTMIYEGQQLFYVELTRSIVPSIENLNDMTEFCVWMADKFKIEYDGWYVELPE